MFDMMKNVYCPHVQHSLFLSDFNEACIFSDIFSINTLISNFMKIRPVGAELFPCGQTDGQTDMKLTAVFVNVAKSA